jgi:hypothetical protein
MATDEEEVRQSAGFGHRRRGAGDPKGRGVPAGLWNADIGAEYYSAHREQYQAAILEQYKLYVEMADRISARRSSVNMLFVTINAAVLTFAAALWRDKPDAPRGFLLPPLLLLLLLCLAWFLLVRSYRQLNTAKYAVIGQLEARLPASPYWRAEWAALAGGTRRSTYWPLSQVEQWLPGIFATAYLAGFCAVFFSGV